jgi:hypothetical protein
MRYLYPYMQYPFFLMSLCNIKSYSVFPDVLPALAPTPATVLSLYLPRFTGIGLQRPLSSTNHAPQLYLKQHALPLCLEHHALLLCLRHHVPNLPDHLLPDLTHTAVVLTGCQRCHLPASAGEIMRVKVRKLGITDAPRAA